MKNISYAQNFEDIILLRAFKNQKKGFFIDIGCHHPIEDSVTFNFYKLGWRGINIDPDESFNNLYSDLRPQDIMINTTISNRNDKDLDFYLVKETGLSSFNIEELDTSEYFVDQVKVNSKTLDQIILENNLQDKVIDLIKIDAEGHEKKIIEGWNLSIKCKCVVYEITNLNDDDKKFILDKLDKRGFELVYEDGINNFLLHKDFSDLKKFFEYPVNVNDQFITYNYQKNIVLKENEKNELKRMYFGLVSLINTYTQDSLFKLDTNYNIFSREFVRKVIIRFKILLIDLYKSLHKLLPNFISNKLLKILKKIFPGLLFLGTIEETYKSNHKNEIEIEEGDKNIVKKDYAIKPIIGLNKINRKILIDFSEILKTDHQTGIQRVSKKITINLLKKYNKINEKEKNFELGKSYLNENNVLIVGCRDNENFYRYVNYPTAKLIDILNNNQINQIIDISNDELFPKYNFQENDIFLGLDYCVNSVLNKEDFLQKLKRINVKLYFFVYDLLPVNYPQWFFKRVEKFTRIWLKEISQFHGVICISKNTRDDYLRFLKKHSIDVSHNFITDVIPMGHDISEKENRTYNENDMLTKNNSFIDFLIVGTIEPRKAHLEMLKAFELLWQEDRKIRLTVVGKKGWLSDSVINKFINNGHFKDYFFYFSNVDDNELSDIYKKSDVLIIPSYNEGFGLPIIEAKKYNKHIVARNIPVFREIIGENGNFFPDTNINEISSYMKKWIKDLRNGKIKKNNIESSTWEESTNQLVKILDKNVSF